MPTLPNPLKLTIAAAELYAGALKLGVRGVRRGSSVLAGVAQEALDALLARPPAGHRGSPGHTRVVASATAPSAHPGSGPPRADAPAQRVSRRQPPAHPRPAPSTPAPRPPRPAQGAPTRPAPPDSDGGSQRAERAPSPAVRGRDAIPGERQPAVRERAGKPPRDRAPSERAPAQRGDHVSDGAVPAAEFADPGAQDGAGAQVRVEPPWRGYSRLKASEVTDRLVAEPDAVLSLVMLYEGSHRRRRTVLDAAQQELSRRRPSTGPP